MKCNLILSPILPVLLLVGQAIAQPQKDQDAPPWKDSGLKGKIDSYLSKMDGERRSYGICATSDSNTPKPLVVVVSPGASTDAGPDEIRMAELYAWYAKKNSRECVVLRSTGRGPGSVYQNYGELDVLEGIEDVVAKYPIDRDRISVTGFSMGGAATWYLASHYPELFAAAAPMAGYCDYRLWEKPGGSTFPMQPWEEPSWQQRSAAFLVENFEHTPLWIVHGEWDRSVRGGVPVAHSRKMIKLLKAKGYDVRYTEVQKMGHSAPQEVFEEVVNWMIQQKKERHPKHVSLTTYELRHNRSYWVAADELQLYGQRSSIDANQTSGAVVVKTENVRAFSVGPTDGTASTPVRVDGQAFPSVDLGVSQSFHRSANGGWIKGAVGKTGQKHHGQSGPLSDIYFDNVILVAGTSGSDEENFFNLQMANNLRDLFNSENGGLHRGGIRGENSIDLPSLKDGELSEGQIRNNNLLLFGTDKSNLILRRYRDKLPVAFQAGAIRLGDRTYSGEQVAVFAVFPHPDNPGRYVAVTGGVTPDAITYGSHLSYQLLPDYIVFDGGKMLDWGFWDNAWKHPSGWQPNR
jgi:predicted esterase